MDDLISRQAAIDSEYQVKIINDIEYVMLSEVLMKMRKLPSAQPEKVCIAKITLSEEQVRKAVEKAKSETVQVFSSAQPEIIRCKDCIYYRQEVDMCDEPYSTAHNVVHEDDYCSRAERKEKE